MAFTPFLLSEVAPRGCHRDYSLSLRFAWLRRVRYGWLCSRHPAEAGMAKPAQRKRTTRTRRGGLTRRELAMLPVAIGAMASGRAEAEASLAVEDTSLADVAQALAGGKITASVLARAYLARIEAYDRAGPALNSVREINPDALSLAARLDGVKPSARQ